ncbi:prolipoprotein diacylglyceryl transferase [bacterium]|nr:prolipoprotein diacylglyceryl transferase [bacterium]
MHPILFTIGQFEIYSYGVLMALAFYLSLYLLIKDANQPPILPASEQAHHETTGEQTRKPAGKTGIDTSTVLDIVFWIILSGILGGKLAYIFFNLPLYIQNPLDASLWRGGFIFHGGFFLSLATVFFYTKKKKLSYIYIVDLIIPYVALGQAIGRIGCFLNGCCYGKPTNLPIGKVFNLNSPAGYHYGALPLHPTQLYSSIFLFILFLLLKKTRENQKFKGKTLLVYLILYPTFRFFLDFLRGDGLEIFFYRLTLFQIICAGIVGISLVVLTHKFRKQKADNR